MRGPPGTPYPPLPGPATDRQGLAGVLARHVLHSHSEVAHGALAAAEVEAMWVYIEQVPVGTGVGASKGQKRLGLLKQAWPGTQDSGHMAEALKAG